MSDDFDGVRARDPRAGQGYGLKRYIPFDERRKQAPSLSDMNLVYAEPNDLLKDQDGAIVLWSE